MFFREACEGDIPAIVVINNERALPRTKNGFVIGTICDEDVYSILHDRRKKIYVGGEYGAVDAFIITASDEKASVLDAVCWNGSEKCEMFLQIPRVYIEKVAVRSSIERRGLAGFLYMALFDLFPSRLFYVFIARAPFDNEASVQFHCHLNFNLFGVYKAALFQGLQNYRSDLYVRCQSAK